MARQARPPSIRPLLIQATRQSGHSSIRPRWRRGRTVTPWGPDQGGLLRKVLPEISNTQNLDMPAWQILVMRWSDSDQNYQTCSGAAMFVVILARPKICVSSRRDTTFSVSRRREARFGAGQIKSIDFPSAFEGVSCENIERVVSDKPRNQPQP